MGIFRRKVPSHLIPVHPANAVKKDWVIVLEAGTIVGPSPERLRVARCTQERTSSSWKDMIHESIPYISVPNCTDMTPIRNSYLYKARKSEE